MSTLKTHNLQSPDSGSVNIALAPNAGMVVAGVSTFAGNIDANGGLDVGNIQLGNAGIITAVTILASGYMTIDGNINITTGKLRIPDTIEHYGDSDTKIRFPSLDTITFETAGSERLRINSSGNVGIATDLSGGGGAYGRLSVVIPSQSGGSALQVMNSAVGSGDGSLTNIVLRSVNNLGTQWAGAEYRAHEHIFKNQGTEAFRIKSDGKVGIGTDNPTQIFNICGTNVKPVIGHRTEHTPLYSSYNGQNNTSLEITSSGTGTNVAGLTINNPTTAAGASYKTISFSCSGTSSSEKRACIISSNHDEEGSSSLKGNFYVSTNNGSGLQQNLQINHDGYVTKPNNAMFKVRRTNNQAVSSNGWVTIQFNNKTATNCFDIGGNFNTGNYRFTAPVTGYYQFGLNQRVDGADGDYFRVAFSVDGDVGASNNYPYGHAIYRDVDGFAYYSFSITSLIYLTSGQYVRAEAYAHSDTTWYLQDESLFYGYLVG